MLIKSNKGDWYCIPIDQAHECEEYKKAVEDGDKKTMKKFEKGKTGWKYVPELSELS